MVIGEHDLFSEIPLSIKRWIPFCNDHDDDSILTVVFTVIAKYSEPCMIWT